MGETRVFGCFLIREMLNRDLSVFFLHRAEIECVFVGDRCETLGTACEPDLSRIVAYQTTANSGAGVGVQTDDQPDSGQSIENLDCCECCCHNLIEQIKFSHAFSIFKFAAT